MTKSNENKKNNYNDTYYHLLILEVYIVACYKKKYDFSSFFN